MEIVEGEVYFLVFLSRKLWIFLINILFGICYFIVGGKGFYFDGWRGVVIESGFILLINFEIG